MLRCWCLLCGTMFMPRMLLGIHVCILIIKSVHFCFHCSSTFPILTYTLAVCLDAGSCSLRKIATYGYISKIQRRGFQSRELKIVVHSILKLQLWWRHNLSAKERIKSVITIQAHVRGWIVRKEATRKRQCIVLIQVSYFC